jgi:hypothetical protein
MPLNPLIHFGVGRTAAPCTPLNNNLDVLVMTFASDVTPELKEKKKYRIRGVLRNAGTALAMDCRIEAWWSPPNITGSSMQRCTSKSLLTGAIVSADTGIFYVNPNAAQETSDLLWDVPDLASIPLGAQGSFKIILKAFYMGSNGTVSQQPNPALSPECDPCCAVRTITIVGV